MKKTTIKDIARELNITPTTVSNALNNKGRVGEALIKKIIKKTIEMGYAPNVFARALVSGRTNRIAVLMPGFTSMFGMGVLESIEHGANKFGYEIIVHTNTGGDYALDDIASAGKADAAIGIAVNAGNKTEKLFEQNNIPLVLVEGKASSGGNMVEVNNEKAACDAVEYLVRRKRKKIAIITGLPDPSRSQNKRIKGYRRALTKHGIKINKALNIKINGYSYEAGCKAFSRISGRGIDAAFCAAGDMAAAGFINSARASGIRVPEDIAVIGFDDIATAKAMDMTTVKQPLKEMGEAAFDRISSILGGSSVMGNNTMFDAALVVRKTA